MPGRTSCTEVGLEIER